MTLGTSDRLVSSHTLLPSEQSAPQFWKVRYLRAVAVRVRAGTIPVRKCPLWVISGHQPADQGCPLCPHEKRTCSASRSMSALCHKQTYGQVRKSSLEPGSWQLVLVQPCHLARATSSSGSAILRPWRSPSLRSRWISALSAASRRPRPHAARARPRAIKNSDHGSGSGRV